ncbi:hypothetical protein AAJV73_06620 [Cyanobium sp. BSA11S]|nr:MULTISPECIES: hypothetical protein [unclassified Synechococcus]
MALGDITPCQSLQRLQIDECPGEKAQLARYWAALIRVEEHCLRLHPAEAEWSVEGPDHPSGSPAGPGAGPAGLAGPGSELSLLHEPGDTVAAKEMAGSAQLLVDGGL